MKRRIIARRERQDQRCCIPKGMVFGKVTRDGKPVPAPRPTYDNLTLPSVNMPYGGGSSYTFDMMNGINPDYELMETLDDYTALNYYGLDGLKNIDF